jgi:hypothetical protein
MNPISTFTESYKEVSHADATDYARFIFIVLLVLLVLWLWALYALIRYWSDIPLWAKLIGIIGLCSYAVGGPVISLIVIYASRRF